MGTLTEEIFSNKLGRTVTQGETVVVDVNHVMSHDTTTPLAVQAFRKLTQQNGGRVFDARRSQLQRQRCNATSVSSHESRISAFCKRVFATR